MKSVKSATSICVLPEGGVINVQFSDGGRQFRQGDAVDLDAEATAGQTWRDALGAHASAFAEQGEPKEFWGNDGPAQE